MSLALAFPIRFSSGATVLVDDVSDAGVAQKLLILARTEIGERPMVPAYGVTDPTFSRSGLSLSEMNAGLEMFGPANVSVTNVTTSYDRNDDHSVTTLVTFERTES